MRPFSPRMFPDSAQFVPAGYYAGQRAGSNPTFNPNTVTPVPCRVWPVIQNAVRREGNYVPEGVKRWAVFTPTDAGAAVDSEVLATQLGSTKTRTFRVVTETFNCGDGVSWETECEEVT